MVDGVVFLDKPAGITSLEATNIVKQKLNSKRAGNTGVLDPDATGLLIACLGESTKAMPFLMGLDKEYIATINFHKAVERFQVSKALKGFIGKVKQLPPVKSSVARKEREREVYSIKLIKFSPRNIEVEIRCEAGFYIRKFAHDLGQKIGVVAQATKIRRIFIDSIPVSEACQLDQLDKDKVFPLESLLDRIGIKKVFVSGGCFVNIRNGKRIDEKAIINFDKHVGKDDLVGIYIGKKIVAIGKVFQTKPIYIKPDRVFNTVKGVFD